MGACGVSLSGGFSRSWRGYTLQLWPSAPSGTRARRTSITITWTTSSPFSQVCVSDLKMPVCSVLGQGVLCFSLWATMTSYFLQEQLCSVYHFPFLITLFFWKDEVYKEAGRTVLNIPVECLQFSPEEASKDKQLLERLEGEADPSFCLIFTDSIKVADA